MFPLSLESGLEAVRIQNNRATILLALYRYIYIYIYMTLYFCAFSPFVEVLFLSSSVSHGVVSANDGHQAYQPYGIAKCLVWKQKKRDSEWRLQE
jgi:hypothetical protein